MKKIARISFKTFQPSTKLMYSANNFKWSSLNALSDILYKNSFRNYSIDDNSEEDDSLTSLNWLNNISIPLSNTTNLNEDYFIHNNNSSNNSFVQHRSHVYDSSLLQYFPSKLQAALRSEGLFDPLIRHEYKTSWKHKPPFSYTTLICMAMLDLGKPKIALYEIYEWIRENFLYYRKSDSSWQNSVRHNLSLKKCFEKVPRRKDERGKGGFWRINPNHTENLGTNLIKYRRQFQVYATPPNNYPISTGGSSLYHFNAPSTDSLSSTFRPNPSVSSFKQNSQQGNYIISNRSRDDLHQKSFTKSSHSKPPLFKKPYALSSLNQFKTVDENDHVVAQMRLCDSPSPKTNSPTLYSLTDDHEALLSAEISPQDSHYSTNFAFDDFDSTTSSSFDTDFSCSSHFHTSSDDSFSLHLPLDIDEFLPHL